MKDGNFLPYNLWQHVIQNSKSYDNLLMGVGGVLYPPRSFYGDVLKEKLFMQYAPTADDLWIWAMVVMNKTKINVICNRNSTTIPVPNVNNEFALYNENSIGKNDEQLIQIVNHYPEILKILNN